MRKFLFGIGVLLVWGTVMLSSCRTSAPQGLSVEAQRRYDYYYVEAVKKKLAGHYDEAFELYRHCLDINPKGGEALFDLGLFYQGLGDSAHCADYLNKAMRSAPDNIYYKEALASFYLRNRDMERAAPVLEDMVRCNATRSDVLAQLVSIYMSGEKYREAIHALDRIETLEGKNTSVALEKFKLYRELDEEDKAFGELESLAKDNPNDLTYRVLIGDQYLLVGKPERAWEAYQEVLSKEPDNLALRISLLDYYKQTGQDSLFKVQQDDLLYGKGVDDRTRAMLMRNYILDGRTVKDSVSSVLAVFDRIFTATAETREMLSLYVAYLQECGEFARMEEGLTRLLNLDRDNASVLLQLIQLNIREKDYEDVRQYAGMGISTHSDQPFFYFYKGWACYMMEQGDEALETFKQGVQRSKKDAEPQAVADMYSIMGDLYYQKDMRDSAFMSYDSCLVYNPENVGCLNNYAYYLSLSKTDLDRAERMSYKTIIAEPNNKTYLDTYAWILFIKGKYTEARIYMERVLTGDFMRDEAVSGGVLEHAGDIYAKCEDMENAMKYWKLAQEKGEDHSKVLQKKIQTSKYIEE